MDEDLRSILTGTAGLTLAAVVSLVLTILRQPQTVGREQTVQVFLLGLAAQSLHFLEEFVTHFEHRFPALLGLSAWSENFFVAFNLIWMSVWILSAVGLQTGNRIALFPVWFFAIASVANGVAHPLLAIAAHGYFPGLITSPFLGVLGVLLWMRLMAFTER